jgi:ankyrin repeat protein
MRLGEQVLGEPKSCEFDRQRQRRRIFIMDLLDAIKAGDAARVQVLLDKDAAAAAGRTPEGVSFVSVAMYHRQPDIARMIAARRTDLDMYEACAVGARERVAELLAADARAGNSFSPDGFAPIALAAFFGQPDIVELLADAGVDVNAQARNAMKVAAIHAAVASRDARSVQVLLNHGADPNLPQQNDITPLHVAEVNADQPIITLLKEHGAH